MRYILLLLLLTGSVASGCDSRENLTLETAMDQAAPASFAEGESHALGEAVTERKLIKTGELTFETSDVKKTKAAVDQILKELNGYSAGERLNNFNDRLQYFQILRVSADKFDLLVQQVEAGAKEVKSKNSRIEDVTEEFIDVEARLKTKKELEARYREILKQAKTVTEIISIEGQIATVRADIESMEGRLKYLTSQVSYSTLEVTYYENIGTDFGFGSKLGNALGSGWNGFLEFLIGLITLWPFLLLITALIWLIRRWWKHRRKKTDQ